MNKALSERDPNKPPESSHKKSYKTLAVTPYRNQRTRVFSTPVTKIQLTDFTLVKKLGQGGFGEVYLCEKKDTKEVLALKILSKTSIWKQNKLQSVKNERDVLAKGAHSHLVQLHYSFQDKCYLYLAMEFCPGGDLFHVLELFNRFEVDEALVYMAEMVVSVHSLHELGYIHRDLKPDNFLIDARGRLKLADFGLSKEGVQSYHYNTILESPLWKEGDNAMHTNKSFSCVGSPDYMAPEVLDPPETGYGKEVDWWSLGCLFFDMVCGYPPFSGDTPHDVFENIKNWRTTLPEALETHREFFTPEFEGMLTCLLCDPQQRMGKDIKTVKSHPLFAPINWDDLHNATPLFVPQLSSPHDTAYFSLSSSSSTVTPRKGNKTYWTDFQSYYNIQVNSNTNDGTSTNANANPQVTFERSGSAREIPSWATPMRRRPQALPTTNHPLYLVTPQKTQTNNDLLGFTYTRPGSVTRTSSVENIPSFPTLNLFTTSQSESLFDGEEEDDELYGEEEEDSDVEMI